jgi:hypothetical protein
MGEGLDVVLEGMRGVLWGAGEGQRMGGVGVVGVGSQEVCRGGDGG